MINTIVSFIFHALMIVLAVYSLIAVYSLLRYGRSKSLGLVVSLLYLVIITSLYVAAVTNLNQI